ncbi:fatty acid desaturase family protein [Flavisolibacter nicotianae]|uniref:fatty acid desaturase family protein n=1 Tax=Flavisolibacter nicotianae TaxID=2364882 RepID=UPI000EAFF196|nr:acyl-CoA desaturase [Flavisolibacter nicotianae]
MSAKIKFNNNNPIFFQSLKKAVDSYFENRGIRKSGNWKLYSKAIIVISLSIAVYLFLLLGTYAWWLGILLSVLLGLALISTAFNVMHDACHKSFSSKKWVNNLMGLTMNALGGNAFLWKIKHNIIHHTYTNIDGVDDDLANGSLLRLCVTQKWRPLHRFQHHYMFFLYAVSSIAWMLVFDFVKYFSLKIHTTSISRIELKEHIIFWVSKLLYVFFYGLVPIYFVGWQAWLTGFLLVHITMGLVMSVIFQLAHVVEKTSFYTTEEQAGLPSAAWAEHEIMTTTDFAQKNKWLSWFIGGLNFQVEHHLFPTVSHIHYPALSEIVREQCQKFSLPYHCYPTMRQAIASHVRLMKQLGKNVFQLSA